MRILLSIHHPLSMNQGAPGVTYQLAKSFEASGNPSRALSFLDMPKPWLLRSPLLEQVRFPWFVARQLRELAGQYDVADCSSGDGWVYQATRKDTKLLMVARSHGLEHLVDEMFRKEVAAGNQHQSWKYPLYHGGYRLWEVARSFRTADLAIFPNTGDRDYALEHLGVKAERAALVPNGIPDAFAGLPLRSARTQGLRIALIGSYGHRKINVAPIALNRLLAKYSDLRVGFLGTGVPNEQVHADYAPEHRDRIAIVPQYAHSDLPILLKDYDVLLFPSLSEGFGLVVYEAMACGLAVIATNLVALSTYMKDGENLLFISPNRPDQMEAAVERLIQEPGTMERLRDAGWKTAQRFTWSRIAVDTMELYREHISRKARE